ncbi:MAG: hypothetical protein APF77_03120 [Clostridia bacterium BRH_c25]|nr:MAG: hypothetical protein APF77_03120 [Clostridia bacterium BRH_c25]
MRYRLIEVFVRIFLWIVVFIINILYFARMMESFPDWLETLLITAGLSIPVILVWFMPSSMAARKVNTGLRYLDKDNDKAVRYFEKYLESKMLTDSERKNALRILGVAHHKRGDDEEAIRCLNQALEGQDRDNDLKVEIMGAIGIIYSESGEYEKAVEYFDKTFDIIFSMSKAHIDKSILIQVVNAYIRADNKEKAVMIYDRLLMIRGFKRDKRVEELLGI